MHNVCMFGIFWISKGDYIIFTSVSSHLYSYRIHKKNYIIQVREAHLFKLLLSQIDLKDIVLEWFVT